MDPDAIMSEVQPIPADTLIVGATLVTMDAGRRVIEDGALAIAGDRIVAVGPRHEVEPVVRARERIDGRRFVMTPGFVNGHVHVTETLLKNLIREDMAFDEAIWGWLVPLYHSHTPEEQRIAAPPPRSRRGRGPATAPPASWRPAPCWTWTRRWTGWLRPAYAAASGAGCRTAPSTRRTTKAR